MEQQEIEVNFRWDGHGRTIPSTEQATASSSTEKDGDGSPIKSYEPCSTDLAISHAIDTTTTSSSGTPIDQSHSLIDELLFDCEISDCGLMPRTFWMPSQGMEPRCNLEQMALDVFRHHVASNAHYDPQTSGAEWWVQIRPSPKTGRYTMHAQDDNDSNAMDMAKEGISFHWDKDEDLRILCGGNTYVHPHLSTVTYLTDLGAPTMALNIRVNQMTGDYIVPTEQNNEDDKIQAFLSWPKFGKHLSFDGGYLHAAPSNLMQDGAFQKQCEMPCDDGNTTAEARKKLGRRHRRVTFLVNIWLNYKPFGVEPFPDTMISKLSGHGEGNSDKIRLGVLKNSSTGITTCTPKTVGIAKGDTATRFQWPMGDCASKEFIEIDVPLEAVQKEASTGGSLSLEFHGKDGVILTRPDQKSSEEQDPVTEENSGNQKRAANSSNGKEIKRPRTKE